MRLGFDGFDGPFILFGWWRRVVLGEGMRMCRLYPVLQNTIHRSTFLGIRQALFPTRSKLRSTPQSPATPNARTQIPVK